MRTVVLFETLIATLLLIPFEANASSTDRSARYSAQRGLDYLARETPRWQKQHNCYGCHVQAVTMQAATVGKQNGYTVRQRFLQSVLDGLTTMPGGARSEHGLSHSGGREPADAKSYGGSALASYDLHINKKATDDLLSTAKALLAHQRPDGSVHPEVARFPVSPSPVHSTYRAVQTWRQAFARTADDVWLTPLRQGERYLSQMARVLVEQVETAPLQDLNYAALGLLEAGAGRGEQTVERLRSALLKRQNKDGGWTFARGHNGFTQARRGRANQKRQMNRIFQGNGLVQQVRNDRAPASSAGTSVAYATGQTLYTLRVLGMTDDDQAIRRGTAWLITKQNKNGSWSTLGSGKAEAMWAVLGLVSIDVANLTVAGIKDGLHIENIVRVTAHADDNQGGKVKRVELYLDDVLIHRQKGNRLSFDWHTCEAEDGMHLVDIVATTSSGRTARRRIAVYAGDHYLTDVGSRFADGGTLLSLRNIDPAPTGEVKLAILDGENVVWTSKEEAQTGAMSFFWPGKDQKEKAVKAERLIARLSFTDATGKTKHTVQHPFVNRSLEVQRAQYGAVQGSLRGNGQDLANTWVELVNGKGQTIQRARSTRSGQYRFKNVDKGDYRVRVQKKGFRNWEGNVKVSKGKEANNDVEL